MKVDSIPTIPNDRGRFGDYGGKFVPETLMVALEELEEAYLKLKVDEDFPEADGVPSIQLRR